MIRTYYLPNSTDGFDRLLLNGDSNHQKIYYDEADEAWTIVPCEVLGETMNIDKIRNNIIRDRHHYMSHRMRNLFINIEEILPEHCNAFHDIHLQDSVVGILKASGCVFGVKSEDPSSFDILYYDHTYDEPVWEKVFAFDGNLTTSRYISSTKYLDSYRRRQYIKSSEFDYYELTGGNFSDVWIRKYLLQGDSTLYDKIPEEVVYQTVYFNKSLRTWMFCDPQLRINKYKSTYKRFFRFYFKSGKSWKLLFGENQTFCNANKFDYKSEAMVWFNRLRKSKMKLENNLFLVPCDNGTPITKDRIAVS